MCSLVKHLSESTEICMVERRITEEILGNTRIWGIPLVTIAKGWLQTAGDQTDRIKLTRLEARLIHTVKQLPVHRPCRPKSFAFESTSKYATVVWRF